MQPWAGLRTSSGPPATSSLDRLPPVQVVLFTVLGACVMVIAYALGIPGPVAGILFLGGVFTGALLRVARPIIDWLTRP
jgi:hypothetical protein